MEAEVKESAALETEVCKLDADGLKASLQKSEGAGGLRAYPAVHFSC